MDAKKANEQIEYQPVRRPWRKPELMSASIKDITASGSGSGTDGGAAVDMMMSSDRRLKRDVKPIGRSPKGLGIYTFHYVWGGPRYEGVMAQEVLLHRPEAVDVDGAGYYRVDYSQLDVVPRALG